MSELRDIQSQYDDVMEDLKRSYMKHGDCESGKRYGGVPMACTACMAKLRLKERADKWRGRIVRAVSCEEAAPV